MVKGQTSPALPTWTSMRGTEISTFAIVLGLLLRFTEVNLILTTWPGVSLLKFCELGCSVVCGACPQLGPLSLVSFDWGPQLCCLCPSIV